VGIVSEEQLELEWSLSEHFPWILPMSQMQSLQLLLRPMLPRLPGSGPERRPFVPLPLSSQLSCRVEQIRVEMSSQLERSFSLNRPSSALLGPDVVLYSARDCVV